MSTADITDATPVGEGGYSLLRALTFDIARQYVDGVWPGGPEFDVILGGGMEHFNKRTAANSGDSRELMSDLRIAGFTYVSDRTQLNALTTTAPNFNGFNNQPLLDEVTSKAIASLSKGGAPFILTVEGASIDKQSHPNHAAGVIWDVIEFDKAVGVGRTYAATSYAPASAAQGQSRQSDTLVVVTADHDQSMHIVGVTDTTVPNYVTNTRSTSVYPRTLPTYDPGSRTLAPGNAGSNVGEVTGFPNYVEQQFSGGRYPNNANQYQLGVGFRTGNHTGSSVPVTAEDPGALLFAGYFNQTDIFFKMAKARSSNTRPLDDFLRTRERYTTISQKD